MVSSINDQGHRVRDGFGLCECLILDFELPNFSASSRSFWNKHVLPPWSHPCVLQAALTNAANDFAQSMGSMANDVRTPKSVDTNVVTQKKCMHWLLGGCLRPKSDRNGHIVLSLFHFWLSWWSFSLKSPNKKNR